MNGDLSVILHRYAVTIPVKAEHEQQEKWCQIAQVIIVLAAAWFSTLALIYSVAVFESPLLGVCSILVIIGAGTHIWDLCNDWIRKQRKWIEIATIFERLNAADYSSPTHRILQARFIYHSQIYTQIEARIQNLIEQKEGLKKSAEENAPQIYDLCVEIHAKRQQAAIAKINLAWLQVLSRYPDFQGELINLCYYREKKFEVYGFHAWLSKEIPNTNAFLYFEREEPPLTIEQVFEESIEVLSQKIFPDVSETSESEDPLKEE